MKTVIALLKAELLNEQALSGPQINAATNAIEEAENLLKIDELQSAIQILEKEPKK